jgi:hypothetical protein
MKFINSTLDSDSLATPFGRTSLFASLLAIAKPYERRKESISQHLQVRVINN